MEESVISLLSEVFVTSNNAIVCLLFSIVTINESVKFDICGRILTPSLALKVIDPVYVPSPSCASVLGVIVNTLES